MSSIVVTPLREDLPFGARISGVTREKLGDEAVRREINAVFQERGMIVFEGVEQTAKMQVMLSEVFGPLKEHPVKIVERVDADSLPGVITIRTNPKAAIVEIDGKPLMTWQPWHFDHSYNNELNRAGVLRAETIAPEGGRTGFADGIQIYNDLSNDTLAKIEDLDIVYTLDLHYARQKFGLPKTFREIQSKDDAILEFAKTLPRALHPVVWTRDTGEKVLHMSPYGARGIKGMENEEGDALFHAAWGEIEDTIKPYFHDWKPGDMLIWDNWRMLHMACGCDPKYDRIMHRTTIAGDYGWGRWETEKTVPDTLPEMM